jgi:hypothetical protein
MESDEQEAVVSGASASHTPAKPDENFARTWIAIRRRYLRRQRIERFMERNPIAWFFDEFPPQEMYSYSREFRRTTRQEARYHWLRQRSGWTFLSYLGTTTGVRFAAISGLTSAVFQAAPALNPQGSTAAPFRWLLISGAMYLLAVVWFEMFCPLLLKQTLKPKEGPLGMHGRRWLRALVEDELRRWWKKRKWIPHPSTLDLSSGEDKTTLEIMAGYATPVYAGFGVRSRAQIDLALEEFAKTRKIQLWEPSDEDDKPWRSYSIGYGLEGNRPWMQTLRIHQPSSYEIERQEGMSARDLIVEWDKVGVGISHQMPNRRTVQVSREAEGLGHLFENDEDAKLFATIVAGWQDTMCPIRRALLFVLYLASLTTFLCFIVSQVHTVMHGMTFL